MALSCQTQLFEVFDYTVLNFEDYNCVKRLNKVVKQAINLCSVSKSAQSVEGTLL